MSLPFLTFPVQPLPAPRFCPGQDLSGGPGQHARGTPVWGQEHRGVVSEPRGGTAAILLQERADNVVCSFPALGILLAGGARRGL